MLYFYSDIIIVREGGANMRKGWLRHLDFILVDIASIELSLILTFLLFYFVLDPAGHFGYWQLYLFFPLVHVFVSIMLDTYNGILQRGYLKELQALFKLEFVIFSLYLLFFYFMEILPIVPRWLILVYFLFDLPVTYCLRFLHKFILRRYYEHVKHTRQIVVVTTEDVARKMIHTITQSVIRNYQFFGLVIVDRSMAGEKIDHVTVSADRNGVIDYVKNSIVDEIFLNIPNDPVYTLQLAKQLLEMGITVHIYMEDAYDSLPNRCISNVFGYNVLTTTISPISFRQSLFKRCFDLAGGIVGVFLALLIGIVIGPVIFIKSPGPILFSQIRVGKNGRQFRIYKFRSMYTDAEERKKELMEQNKIQDGLMFKIENDPRIIKGIGNFIRKTSLDEFPQFWNVLKGDMSLVGTRPPTIDEYQKYSPHHKRRLNMRPGITGLWQVSGRSTITDFEDVVRLDTEYIENWSLDLDIKIILRTVSKLLRNNDAF